MNRAKRRGEELRQILVVRQTSTRLAQQQAQQARHSLREAEQLRENEAALLTDVIAQWNSARGAPLFDPLTLSAWGNAVIEQADVLAGREATVVQCDADMVSAKAVHDRAIAEEHCADGLLRRARVCIARAREEGRLAERDDINTRRICLR